MFNFSSLSMEHVLHFSQQHSDPPDKWEVLPTNIETGKLLGEGAFGKVYIASVKGTTMISMPKFDTSEKQNDISIDLTMTAAVKRLDSKYSHTSRIIPYPLVVSFCKGAKCLAS